MTTKKETEKTVKLINKNKLFIKDLPKVSIEDIKPLAKIKTKRVDLSVGRNNNKIKLK